jgi:hypothetical protein
MDSGEDLEKRLVLVLVLCYVVVGRLFEPVLLILQASSVMCSTRRLRDKKVFGGQTFINPAYVSLESSLTRSVRTTKTTAPPVGYGKTRTVHDRDVVW